MTPNQTEAEAFDRPGGWPRSADAGRAAKVALVARGCRPGGGQVRAPDGCTVVRDGNGRRGTCPGSPCRWSTRRPPATPSTGRSPSPLAEGLDQCPPPPRFANAAGALACTVAGAQPSAPTRPAVERFLSTGSARLRWAAVATEAGTPVGFAAADSTLVGVTIHARRMPAPLVDEPAWPTAVASRRLTTSTSNRRPTGTTYGCGSTAFWSRPGTAGRARRGGRSSARLMVLGRAADVPPRCPPGRSGQPSRARRRQSTCGWRSCRPRTAPGARCDCRPDGGRPATLADLGPAAHGSTPACGRSPPPRPTAACSSSPGRPASGKTTTLYAPAVATSSPRHPRPERCRPGGPGRAGPARRHADRGGAVSASSPTSGPCGPSSARTRRCSCSARSATPPRPRSPSRPPCPATGWPARSTRPRPAARDRPADRDGRRAVPGGPVP